MFLFCFIVVMFLCLCFLFCCLTFHTRVAYLKTQNTIKILHKFLRNNLNVNNNNIVTEVAAHFLLGLVVVVFI